MKPAANIILHLLIGAGCFATFWRISYGASENGNWAPVYAAGVICALIAFITSFCGSRFLTSGRNKQIPALAFVALFGLGAVISFVEAFDGQNIIWKPLAFWLPITVGLFLASYGGATLASRAKTLLPHQ